MLQFRILKLEIDKLQPGDQVFVLRKVMNVASLKGSFAWAGGSDFPCKLQFRYDQQGEWIDVEVAYND